LIFGFITYSIVAILISQQTDGTFFMILAPMAIACVFYLVPYFLGVAAYLDPQGGLPASVAAMFFLTGATGPVLGGFLVETWEYQAVGWSVTIGSTIAFLFILYILGPHERRQMETS
jgi:predicted MFS family arabinose efflux permease